MTDVAEPSSPIVMKWHVVKSGDRHTILTAGLYDPAVSPLIESFESFEGALALMKKLDKDDKKEKKK